MIPELRLDKNLQCILSKGSIPIEHLQLDITMQVALANLAHGLLKVHYALAATGGGDAFFLPTSDFSTTRNPARWRAGFSYGGIFVWQSSRPIVFPELRPNACGVLLGRQEGSFDWRSLSMRIREARKIFADDWDYNKSNHFLGLYKHNSESYFLLHGGTKSTKRILGMFECASVKPRPKILTARHCIKTPYGHICTLQDDNAIEYYSTFKECEKRIKNSREALASFLFPSSTILFHETHQGLISPTTMALGAYVFHRQEEQIPFMIAPGEPIFLLSQGFSIHSQVVQLTKQAQMTIKGSLGGEKIWISPHGSGDYLADVEGFSCTERNGERLFQFSLSDGRCISTDNPSELREGYRSRYQAASALTKLGIEIGGLLENVATIKS